MIPDYFIEAIRKNPSNINKLNRQQRRSYLRGRRRGNNRTGPGRRKQAVSLGNGHFRIIHHSRV